MKEIQVDSEIKNIQAIIAFAEEELEAAGGSMKVQMQIDVAIDEIASNICYYGYGDNIGKITVQTDYDADTHMFSMIFIDSGKKYNPLEKEDPDVTLAAEDRGVGGLGIFIVKKSMDEVSYENRDGKNMLTIKKKLA